MVSIKVISSNEKHNVWPFSLTCCRFNLSNWYYKQHYLWRSWSFWEILESISIVVCFRSICFWKINQAALSIFWHKEVKSSPSLRGIIKHVPSVRKQPLDRITCWTLALTDRLVDVRLSIKPKGISVLTDTQYGSMHLPMI